MISAGIIKIPTQTFDLRSKVLLNNILVIGLYQKRGEVLGHLYPILFTLVYDTFCQFFFRVFHCEE